MTKTATLVSRIVGTTVITAIIVLLALLLIDGKKIKAELNREQGASLCPSSHPIYVEIYNYSFKKIAGANFSMELVSEKGSENLLHNPSRIFDKEVSPFSKEYVCYSDAYIDGYIQKKTTIDVNEMPYNFNTNGNKEGGGNESSTMRISFSEVLRESNARRDLINTHSVAITESYYNDEY